MQVPVCVHDTVFLILDNLAHKMPGHVQKRKKKKKTHRFLNIYCMEVEGKATLNIFFFFSTKGHLHRTLLL